MLPAAGKRPRSAPPGPVLDPSARSSPAPRRLALPGPPACLLGRPPPCGSPLAPRALVSGEVILNALTADGRGLLLGADIGRPAPHLVPMRAELRNRTGMQLPRIDAHAHAPSVHVGAREPTPGKGPVGRAAGPCAHPLRPPQSEGAGRIRSRTGAAEPGRMLDYLGIGCLFGPLCDAWHLSRDSATGYG